MLDKNRVITPIFNISVNDEQQLIATSDHSLFTGTEIHLDTATPDNLIEKLTTWCEIFYTIVNDLPMPERIMITEMPVNNTGIQSTFKARIVAPA